MQKPSQSLSFFGRIVSHCHRNYNLRFQHYNALCCWRNYPSVTFHSGCSQLTSSGLSNLIQLRQLEELELTNCPGSSKELVIYLRQVGNLLTIFSQLALFSNIHVSSMCVRVKRLRSWLFFAGSWLFLARCIRESAFCNKTLIPELIWSNSSKI